MKRQITYVVGYHDHPEAKVPKEWWPDSTYTVDEKWEGHETEPLLETLFFADLSIKVGQYRRYVHNDYNTRCLSIESANYKGVPFDVERCDLALANLVDLCTWDNRETACHLAQKIIEEVANG